MNTSITEKHFGIFENKVVTEYTISNKNGMQVSVINYGATITKLITVDKYGSPGNVVIGFDTLDDYLKNSQFYFGCIVGRYCNRIANASFKLDGKEYRLAKNNDNNSLHGGIKGFDKMYWDIEKQDGSLKLTYLSKDGEEGFPGNLNVELTYTVTDDNSLKINYKASTDKATPVNFTNHSYFNLSAGRSASVLDHELTLFVDQYTEVDDKLIPTGRLLNVKNTSLDFTHPKKIGADMHPGGYDHNYVLKNAKAASLYDPVSGRMMEMFTTEPGLQFYSANFLHEISPEQNEKKTIRHPAACLEAQHFPNSPNEPGFPNTILRPGEVYRQTTEYKFSVMN